MYTEIEGNLLELANDRKFDIVCHAHDCSCGYEYNGLTRSLEKLYTISTDKFEDNAHRFFIGKLGNFIKKTIYHENPNEEKGFTNYSSIFTLYTFYTAHGKLLRSPYGIPFDYDAFRVILRKFSYLQSPRERIAFGTIGCGSQEANWELVRDIIRSELGKHDVTIVFKKI